MRINKLLYLIQRLFSFEIIVLRLIAFGFLTWMLTISAVAEITILDSTYAENSGWAPISINASEFSGFSLNGAEKLVVTLTGRDATGLSSVKFNGTSLTKAVSFSATSGIVATMECSVWYLDQPGSALGNLEFSGAKRGIAATLWALSGTTQGVGNTASNNNLSVSVTTSSDNSLVIANTGAYIAASTTAPSAQSPLNDGPSGAMNYADKGNEYQGTGSGSQTVDTAGSVTPTFDYGDVTVAVEIISQPPSGTVFSIR